MAKVAVVSRFGYTQTIPASTWIIQHNLNVLSPVVDVWVPENGTGPLVNADAYQVTFNSPNEITITFEGQPVSGQVLIT